MSAAISFHAKFLKLHAAVSPPQLDSRSAEQLILSIDELLRNGRTFHREFEEMLNSCLDVIYSDDSESEAFDFDSLGWKLLEILDQMRTNIEKSLGVIRESGLDDHPMRIREAELIRTGCGYLRLRMEAEWPLLTPQHLLDMNTSGSMSIEDFVTQLQGEEHGS